ncbi:MAG: glycosyltransferase family 4 protein [Acidimicrobiia bacterium]|nr:glycosyltransferase family 4 protein [Acidimicrobiia bacterium]
MITNMYPPHHYGGYELSCQDVVERWRRRGHDVAVLTTDMRVAGVADPPDEPGHGVWRDLRFYYADGDLHLPPLWRRPGLERHNQRVLASTLDRLRPDVVSLWHMGAMSFSLITSLVDRRVPLVCVVCDDWLNYGPDVDGWMRLFEGGRAPLRPAARIVERLTAVPTRLPDLAAAATSCFVSESTRRRAEEHGRWPVSGAPVIPSGVAPEDFPRPDEAPGTRPWRWRLLFVGRLDERKGIDTAVEALADLSADTILDVVGKGDDAYRQRLEAIAANVGAAGRVRFSAARRSELSARYRAADVLVFPVRWDEPFGLTPLEAMASGTPVVATGTGGSGEFLVDGVNSLLFAPGKADGLAAAVRRLADDAHLRAALVRGGYDTAARLTVDRQADDLEALHLAVLARTP